MKAETPTRFVDVSHLPDEMFGKRNASWLGNVLYMTIEGTMFALVIATFFYLKTRSNHWPPSGFIPPALRYGIINLILFTASLAPAIWTKRRAFQKSKESARTGLILLAVLGAISIVIRFFEFYSLNCRWTDNAYASSIWVLLGIHTGHLITECIETLVLIFIAFSDRLHGIRFADIGMNSDYWYFVVGWAAVVDLVIYGIPRWL
jgi:heme/copper-type cytochrome/quinol oxidase subunit 3